MADFSNFELGDNVYELARYVIPEMAEVFQVDIGEVPNVEALDQLVAAVGKKKTLSDNKEGAKAWLTEYTGSEEGALDFSADWMNQSGVQKPLNRSLWTPEIETPTDIESIVITGAVANWQDRTAKYLGDRVLAGTKPGQLYIPVGSRTMDTSNEKANPNVQAFEVAYRQLPTESQYASEVIRPSLEKAGYKVRVMPYDTGDGDQIASRFVEDMPSAIATEILFARVANAGLQLAVQFRKAGRQANPDFDTDSSHPQVFVGTDTFPVARTEEQAADPVNYQNSFTGIRQIALSAKLIHEAAQV